LQKVFWPGQASLIRPKDYGVKAKTNLVPSRMWKE